MTYLNLKLVTPERTVLEQELVSLSCPTPLGQITILPGHASLVSSLTAGELHAKTERDDFYIAVAGGFVEIRPGNNIVVLADAAEHVQEIDLQRAELAKERARKAMEEKLSEGEYAKVAASLERSLARINIARKHAHKKNPLAGEGVFSE